MPPSTSSPTRVGVDWRDVARRLLAKDEAVVLPYLDEGVLEAVEEVQGDVTVLAPPKGERKWSVRPSPKAVRTWLWECRNLRALRRERAVVGLRREEAGEWTGWLGAIVLHEVARKYKERFDAQ